MAETASPDEEIQSRLSSLPICEGVSIALASFLLTYGFYYNILQHTPKHEQDGGWQHVGAEAEMDNPQG
jgi:hypothetical protein